MKKQQSGYKQLISKTRRCYVIHLTLTRWEIGHWNNKQFSSMVFKETYIRWINTDSQTYIKIMYSIVIETIFHFNDVINNYSICGPT